MIIAIKKGYMSFDFKNYSNPDNFYVVNPSAILDIMTNKKWVVEKRPADYKPGPDEYAIEFWSIDGKTGHFARLNHNFNSLQKSRNVEKGKIVSYRICRVVENGK